MHKFLSHPERLFFHNTISLGFYTKQIQTFPHVLSSLGDTQSFHDMSHHHTLNQHHYILLKFTHSPTMLECGWKTCNTTGWPGSQHILKSLQYSIGKRYCTCCVSICAPCSKTHPLMCCSVLCEMCWHICHTSGIRPFHNSVQPTADSTAQPLAPYLCPTDSCPSW